MSIVRDPELLELLGDDPELLALADAVRATQRPARTGLSRPGRLAALAGAVAAVAALVLLSPWDRNSSPSIVDRALAAVGEGPVLHAVVRFPWGSRVELATGEVTAVDTEVEMWLDETKDVLHVLGRRDGQVIDEAAFKASEARADPFTQQLDPFQLAGLYRKLLGSGKVGVLREGVLHGREVVWLDLGPGLGPGSRVRAAIEQGTFRLVQLEATVNRRRMVIVDIVRFESLPKGEHRFPRTEPYESLTAGSGTFEDTRESTLARARTALSRPALWLGRELDGKRLSSIRVGDQTVTLIYGPGRFTSNGFLALTQTPTTAPRQPDETLPPPGFLDLRESAVFTSQGPRRKRWTGRMQTQGMYVTIESWNRSTLLASARSLTPIP